MQKIVGETLTMIKKANTIRADDILLHRNLIFTKPNRWHFYKHQ